MSFGMSLDIASYHMTFTEVSDFHEFKCWKCQAASLIDTTIYAYHIGETEAIVNILYAYVLNELVGLDFDTAFARSMGEVSGYSPNNSAIHWMVTPNFQSLTEMDYSNTEYDEMRYQHRGYAKYADIARLFTIALLNCPNL